MAAKKKASAKKRTPAQRRATAKLVAMNKKKVASRRKKTASRKKVARKTRARTRATPRSTRATARNPVTKRYVVCVTDWPSPGYKNYVSSINWKNGVWIVDDKKTNAIRGTKSNMHNIGESVIEQLRERMADFNPFKNVYLEEV